MSKVITSYQELLEEKKRLQVLLEAQKAIIRQDFEAIKHELEPARIAVKSAAKFFSRDSSNFVLNAGANAVIDLVVKNFLLGKAGWITKRLVPFLLKNYSSHIISENKESWLRKLFLWARKRHANGQESHPADAASN